MRELNVCEIEFFKGLLKYSKRISQNGYYYFQPKNIKYGNTKYVEHRLLFQLYYNVKLEIWEVIHHKDRDKLNNNIDNLEVMMSSKHTSYHHAGSIKIGKFKPHNKFSKDKVNKIIKLSKIILKKDGSPNYSKIGEKLSIAGLTVARYIKANQ